MILRRRSIPSWIWYLGFGALCCGLFLTFDNDWAKAGVQVPVYAASAVLLARCWWKRRAAQREPLLSFAVVAFGLYFCASIWGVILPLTANGPAAMVPAPLDGCFLLSYALLGLLLWKIGSRSAGERRRDILDTLIVTGGVAPAFWLFLVKPLFAVHVPLPALATYVAYPTLVFGLLAMTVRLFFLAGRRTAPHLLLGGWILLELIADVVYLRVSLQGAYVYGQWWQAMWIVSAACVGAVALHPETGLLFERRTTRPVSGSRRLYVLAFCLAAPILLIGFGELQRQDDLWLLVPACAALALIGLLTMRLAGLMVDNASQVRARQELLRLSDDLSHQALHDPLTGLGNRVLFAQRADHALAQRATDVERGTAILLLDLDDFKTVNDTFGHEAGDRVLVEVSRRLERVTRHGEGIYRLGGDEFAFVLYDARLSEVLSLADRICLALGEPLDLGPRTIRPLATMGISIALSGQDRSTLLAEADMAMYSGKDRNTNTASVFDPDLHQATLARHQLERDLRDAVKQDELFLLYQPVVHLAHNDMVGVEALLRWEHPTRGVISPVEFIPLAEANGSINTIGDWVLERAIHQLLAWDDAQPDHRLSISVNVSPLQLADPDFVGRVARILHQNQIDPGRVNLEITEAAFRDDDVAMIGRLHELKGLGLRLAIDDFGTEYSALSRLQRLPVDTLKIDKSFIDDLATEPTAWALATAIIRLAESLGKSTIAEGIETGGQLAHLRSLNVEFGQGFLFAGPLTADAINTLLTAGPGHSFWGELSTDPLMMVLQ